ncbi:hypothetical protein [Nocardioides cynanchi]|uniref:hypothetical protein n=1 Tax=Nocardioides cynanchi TaxID=2558918 RepID=UPI00177BB640|nr:hypothetical protein [Nocardioides cynanchi]
MAGEPSAHPEACRVTATARAGHGRWRVRLDEPPDVRVRVKRLAEVDEAVSARLSQDRGRKEVRAVVHIRWYDADHCVPWPSWLETHADIAD